jgi:hypothetical protein
MKINILFEFICLMSLLGMTIFICSQVKMLLHRSESLTMQKQDNITVDVKRNRDNSSCINVSCQDQVYLDFCNKNRHHALHVRNANGSFQHTLSLTHRQFCMLEVVMQRAKKMLKAL